MKEAPKIQRRHVAAAVIGNALEFYDFVTYAFFAVQLGQVFFPSHDAYASLMLSLGTFGAGFAMRPLGGVLLGRYADKVGRRPAMMLSFGLMGGAILAVALIPSYAAIGVTAPLLVVLARMVQGFALGGEVGSSTAYLVEAAPVYERGFYAAWQGGSQYMSGLFGGIVGVVLTQTLDPASFTSYGWRIAFGIGALALPFGLYMRNRMPETLHLSDTAHMPEQKGRTAELLRGSTRPVVLGLIVLASATIFTYVTNYMTTFAETVLHMSETISLTATLVLGFCGIVGMMFGGWLSDRIGRWPVMVVPRVVYIVVCYPIYLWMVDTRSATALLVGTAFLQLLGTISFAPFYAALTESLPKPIRGVVFGTIYALSIAIFGGTTQVVITWLMHITGSPLAPAVYSLASGVIGTIAMALMRETAPIKLARRASAPALASAE
ncbi:MAG: MFS transporter [Proteobacteria bacterium]|nr:MFS transporter [Pseudomonadota bacterium]